MDPDTFDQQLAHALSDALAGDASPDQRALLARHALDAATVRDVHRVLERPLTPAVDANEVLAAVRVRLHAPTDRSARQSPPTLPTSRFTSPVARRVMSWHWVAAVACVALAVGATVTVRSQRARQAERATSAVREYSTKDGQRATITLRDGTRVMLNVATRLRVPDDFGATRRDVMLDGEAQFDVTHDPARPFVVHAGGTKIRDLATSFSVRAYGGATTQVAVREGRIAVESPTLTPNTAAIVRGGELVSLSAGGQPTVTPLTDSSSAFGWTRGELVLRAVPLGEALLTLRRWYGIEFRTTDRRLLALDVTITLPATLDLDKLRGLAELLGARLEQSGDVMTLIPRS